MKSPKNLLKIKNSGRNLTKEERDLVINHYTDFKVGDVVVYKGGVKLPKLSNRDINIRKMKEVKNPFNLYSEYIISNIDIIGFEGERTSPEVKLYFDNTSYDFCNSYLKDKFFTKKVEDKKEPISEVSFNDFDLLMKDF